MRFELYALEFPNGKKYIGITGQGTLKRWQAHKHCAEKQRKSRLYTAMNKYGAENIIVRTLVVGEREYIKNLEVLAIAQYKTNDKEYGYNSTLGGDGTHGMIMSAERKAQISARSSALWQTQEYRDKVLLNKAPVEYTPELRAVISENTRRQHADPEQSARLRAAVKAKWADPEWRAARIENLNASRTAETYAKIAAKAKFSDAARAASDAYWANPENREKNRQRNLGLKRSPEAIAKIKAARAKQVFTQEQLDKKRFGNLRRCTKPRPDQVEFLAYCHATYAWANTPKVNH